METTLLTAGQVAELLHCSKRYVYKLMDSPNFPGFKIGKKFLVPADELDEWVHSQGHRFERRRDLDR